MTKPGFEHVKSPFWMVKQDFEDFPDGDFSHEFVKVHGGKIRVESEHENVP